MILGNKVAVVTGAGSGIGQATAIRLAKEGAKVALLDINEAGLATTLNMIQDAGGVAMALPTDITKKDAVFAAAKAATDAWKCLDIWVNCAGYSRIVPFLEQTEEIWDTTMNVNLKGCFFGCQAAVTYMNPEGGAIVNFSSESGKKGTNWYAAYCASKFGVIGLTQSVSAEFAPKGIRCNSICPGVVITPMWDKQVADYAKKRNLKPEDVMPRFKNNIPQHRLCELEDVTNLVMFLVTPASSYITGQALNLCGGSTMY